MHSNPTLHHVGYVVDSIAERIESFRASIAATEVSETFHDPIQRSRVVFLTLPTPGAVHLELVEPATPDSPVARFLEKGGGLHHLCYEVDDILAAVTLIRQLGVTVLLVEQRLVEALAIADRAYVLQTGRIVMAGTATAIAADGAVRKAYLGM